MGWFSGDKQGVSVTLQEHEQLKKDVLLLNEKKNNLQKVIDEAIYKAAARLEAAYKKKSDDLEVTYNSKIGVLEEQLQSIMRERERLKRKDAEQIETTKTQAWVASEQEGLSKANLAQQEQNIKDREDYKAYISEQKNILRALSVELDEKSKLLDEKKTALDNRDFKLDDRENLLNEKELELKDRALGIAKLSDEIITLNIETTALAKQATDDCREAISLKKQAENELIKAKTASEEAESLKSLYSKLKYENDILKESLDKKAESLEEWEMDLKIIDKAQNEKEKELNFMQRKIKEAKQAITKEE